MELLRQGAAVSGESIEEGEAELNEIESAWLYKGQKLIPPETTVMIEATALDLPGNRGTAQACFYAGKLGN